MKKMYHYMLLALFTLGTCLTATAAAPSTYYNNAKNKSDQALMTALHNIIKGHTKRSYDQLKTDFKTTDCNGSIIIDRYSDSQFTYGTDFCGTYNSVGDCYNREHSIPNSWWGGLESDTAYTDLHHLFPVDGWVNAERGNHPFGNCSNGSPRGTGKLGTCTFTGYNGTVFEVADEYKGDFARVYFYFATRYMTRISSYTSGTGSVVFTSSSYLCLTNWAINQLLEWHRNDPVSTLETTRNDKVYGIQRNRNPFVDYPELVEYIWGNKKGQTWPSGGSSTTPALSSPANGSTVNVGANTGDGVSKTISVKGSNLTQTLNISVSGTGFTVSPTSLTATAANNGTNVTVTYNGTASSATGTLTISSSEVSATVNLTASYNSGVGPTPGDEVIETWEGCSSGGYWTQEVQGAAFKWYFSNAGLYARDNDHWNGSLGCCFGKNADSYIQMSQDVTDGASKLTFYAAKYGSDANPTIKIQYSTNGGSTWTDIATCTLSGTWKQYSYDLNVTGNVRFKFQQTTGSRLNIDDIAITSNSAPVTNPQITAPANGSTVNVGNIAADGNQVSKIITVKGSDLTKALNVSVTGTGFSVSPSTISAASANAGTSVTVTYSSTTAGNATGTLTIGSTEASVTVNLTASKTPMPVLSITAVAALEAEQDGESTIVSATVSADDNSEDITLSVTGNFEISLNRTTWAQTLTLDPTGETFYIRLADTGTVGSFDGMLTASTSLVNAYAEVQGTVNPRPSQRGDVNMDGKINISDVTVLVNFLLSGSANPFDSAAADVNEDTHITIGDVTSLINMLLTSSNHLAAPSWDAYPATDGICCDNATGEMLEVYDMDGNCCAMITSRGATTIPLPAGIYVVAGDNTSRKVVVK